MARKGSWTDLLDQDFPDVDPITKEEVASIQETSCNLRSSMRIATGRIWTDEEYQRRREKILNTPLP